MKKLDEIRQLCENTISEYAELTKEHSMDDIIAPEQYRAELAEEVLEIMNGEK